MTKRLLTLSGLAILIVVLNHAAGYGQIALFLWADRYLPVSVPNWGALGSFLHYVLIAVRSLGSFAVPLLAGPAAGLLESGLPESGLPESGPPESGLRDSRCPCRSSRRPRMAPAGARSATE